MPGALDKWIGGDTMCGNFPETLKILRRWKPIFHTTKVEKHNGNGSEHFFCLE